jgi:hypothetical protein
MSQTSDNSRTFRIINLTDEVKASLSNLNAIVTQHENINYVEVSQVDDIQPVKSVLDKADMKYKQCSYSTFVRFKDNMTVDQLNKFATSLCKDENINILYSRVDENNHTGKLVVDRLEDYNTLKSNTGDVSFYRFSPLNVPTGQSRGPTRNINNNTNSNDGEWKTVQAPARRQTVQGRYTQQDAGAAPRPSTRGSGRGGRGGARTSGPRGQGRAAPASS